MLAHRRLPDHLQREVPIINERSMSRAPACLFHKSPRRIWQFRTSTPEAARLLETRQRISHLASSSRVAPPCGKKSEPCGINVAPRQKPPFPVGQYDPVAKRAAKRRNVIPQRVIGCARRILAPEQLYQNVHCHHRTATQTQHGEGGARLDARNPHRLSAYLNLEWPQNSQLHRRIRRHVDIVDGTSQQMVNIQSRLQTSTRTDTAASGS